MSNPKPTILYRILGNDLPPRYAPGQTLDNLTFILEHEPELPGLEKRWLLNRIVCPEQLQQLQQCIAAAGHRCDVIPFEPQEYRQAWSDLGATPPHCHPWSQAFEQLNSFEQIRIKEYIGRAKTLYLMNNNGARNHALDLGFADADWVFPWDGGCFLPAWIWPELQEAMQRPGLHYLCSPMHRLRDGTPLPDPGQRDQLALVEPQLGFHRTAALRFDPGLRYGSGPKWQLLQRIGLPGPWQEHQGWLPWEEVETAAAPDQGAWLEAGLALRLSGAAQDGRHVAEESLWRLRFASIRRFTRQIDAQDVSRQLARHRLRCWIRLNRPGFQPDAALLTQLAARAAELEASALPDPAAAGPHPQASLAAICLLVLDARLNGSDQSRRRAVGLVQRCCLQPGSAWSPAGLPLEQAARLGIVVPLLDALTLLQQAGCFEAQQWQQLQAWCDALLSWLTSDTLPFLRQHQGRAAARWQHLLSLALAAFLDRADLCCQVLDNLPALMAAADHGDGLQRQPDQHGPDRQEQRSSRLAWQLLALLCGSLGRELPGAGGVDPAGPAGSLEQDAPPGPEPSSTVQLLHGVLFRGVLQP